MSTVTDAAQVRLVSPDVSPEAHGVSPGSAALSTSDLMALSFSFVICEMGLLGAGLALLGSEIHRPR